MYNDGAYRDDTRACKRMYNCCMVVWQLAVVCILVFCIRTESAASDSLYNKKKDTSRWCWHLGLRGGSNATWISAPGFNAGVQHRLLCAADAAVAYKRILLTCTPFEYTATTHSHVYKGVVFRRFTGYSTALRIDYTNLISTPSGRGVIVTGNLGFRFAAHLDKYEHVQVYAGYPEAACIPNLWITFTKLPCSIVRLDVPVAYNYRIGSTFFSAGVHIYIGVRR